MAEWGNTACRSQCGKTSRWGFCMAPAAPDSPYCAEHKPRERKPVPDELRCKGEKYMPSAIHALYASRTGSLRCTNKRKPGTDWCGLHQPDYVAPNTKRMEARWAAESAKPDLLEVLRRIAAGHNDPRTLAQETIDAWQAVK